MSIKWPFPQTARHLAFGSLLVIMMACPAKAQSIAAFVNGDPITSYDVDQRIKILAVMERRSAGRQAALQDLIDDKAKMIETRRVGYRLTDEHIDDQISRIARANNLTMSEFNARLHKGGIDPNAYRQKVKADFSWDLALKQKFKSQDTVNNAELETATNEKIKQGAAKVTDYTAYSVIFVVAQGASPGSRAAAANAARGWFNNCDTGLERLRQLPDVAVKPPVRRSSDQISPKLAEMLAKTPVGRMTPPFPSEQGIESIAVCEKSERTDTSGVRSRTEQELSAKKAGMKSADYLKEARGRVLVQYR